MSALILVIEDHDEERSILSRYLEFVGRDVMTAADGETGISLARKHRPDLILLDIRLPGWDGWSVMSRLASHPITSEIPVIAVTGLPMAAESIESAGFCGYVGKPLVPFRVLQEVERCLGPIS